LIKLLSRLLGNFGRQQSVTDSSETDENARVSPALPPDRRLYCIGDIHGRLDLLEELHEMIRQDAEGFNGKNVLVYLGDYIDRGAQSRQVLDLLLEQPFPGFETVHLLGNHEQAMLDFLESPRDAAAWLKFGGNVTLLSYGVGVGKIINTMDIELLCEELEEKLPQNHRDFLQSCKLTYSEGNYLFVHAGIRPGVALEDQLPADLLWIRDEFICSRKRHDHIVVHGHSISAEVEWRPNRIGIDTAAYESGLLTALVLQGQDQRVLQTGRNLQV
jgi:serine/threonine protein phosphatase 1